jgi:methyl-accepting chemotaxis protein
MQQPLGPSYGESFRILSTFKQEILFQSILIYAFTIGVVLAGIVAITLLYSHRVVGPIYRLNMFVKRIAEGDVSKTTSLRQKDVIHSLADEINTMVLSYQTTLNALKEKNNKLVQLTKLEEKEKNDEPERLHAELASNVREIDKIVNAIKI